MLFPDEILRTAYGFSLAMSWILERINDLREPTEVDVIFRHAFLSLGGIVVRATFSSSCLPLVARFLKDPNGRLPGTSVLQFLAWREKKSSGSKRIRANATQEF